MKNNEMLKNKLDKYFGQNPGGLRSAPPIGIIPRSISAGSVAAHDQSELDFCIERNTQILECLERYNRESYYTSHALELLKEFEDNATTICVIKKNEIEEHLNAFKALPLDTISESAVKGVELLTGIMAIAKSVSDRFDTFIRGTRNG